MNMKKIILALTMLVAITATASAQAEIKFEKLVHDFGTFEESNPVQKATFTFTNVGNITILVRLTNNKILTQQVIPIHTYYS